MLISIYLIIVYPPPHDFPKKLRVYAKWRWKDCKSQRWWMTPSKQCLRDTTRLKNTKTQTLWKHTQSPYRLNSDKIPVLREKWAPIPSQEAICNWYLLTLQGRLHAQEKLDNTKQIQWYFFLKTFCLILLCLGIFFVLWSFACIIWFLFLYVFYVCMYLFLDFVFLKRMGGTRNIKLGL